MRPHRRLIGTAGLRAFAVTVWADDGVELVGPAPFGGSAYAIRVRPQDVDELVTLLLEAKRHARAVHAAAAGGFEEEPETQSATPSARLRAVAAADVCRSCGHMKADHPLSLQSGSGQLVGACVQCVCDKFEP